MIYSTSRWNDHHYVLPKEMCAKKGGDSPTSKEWVTFWGFHSHGGTPKWLVYSRKSQTKMDDNWGYPILGNLHWTLQERLGKAIAATEVVPSPGVGEDTFSGVISLTPPGRTGRPTDTDIHSYSDACYRSFFSVLHNPGALWSQAIAMMWLLHTFAW